MHDSVPSIIPQEQTWKHSWRGEREGEDEP